MGRSAIVEELAALGAAVHTCSRNRVELDRRVGEWQEKGFRVSGSVCDLTSRQQREQLMETVSSVFGGKLNVLVSMRCSCHPLSGFPSSRTCPSAMINRPSRKRCSRSLPSTRSYGIRPFFGLIFV